MTAGAVVFPLNICTCLSLTAHNTFRPVKKKICTVTMVSIVLWWSLGTSVFSSHASGSPWDPWESAKPTLQVRNVWAAMRPACPSFLSLFLSFFFLFYFMTLGFLNLQSGNHSFWHRSSSGATVLLMMRYKLSAHLPWQLTELHTYGGSRYSDYLHIWICGNSRGGTVSSNSAQFSFIYVVLNHSKVISGHLTYGAGLDSLLLIKPIVPTKSKH